MDNDAEYSNIIGVNSIDPKSDCDNVLGTMYGSGVDLSLDLANGPIIPQNLNNFLNGLGNKNVTLTCEQIIRCIIQKVPEERNRIRLYSGIVQAFDNDKDIYKEGFLFELLFAEQSRDVDRLAYTHSKQYGEVHYHAISFLLERLISEKIKKPRLKPQSGSNCDNEIKSLISEGERLIANNKFDDAIFWFAKVIERHPQIAIAWDYKGYCHGEMGHWDEALECYNNAIGLDDSCSSAWFHKGEVLAGDSEYEQALDCYDKALEIDSGNKRVLFKKGYAFERLGEYRNAIKWYDRALEIENNDAEIWINKGYNFEQLKEYNEALECYRRASMINPNKKEIWFIEGTLLTNIWRYDEAILAIEKALNIDHNYQEALNLKDQIQEKIPLQHYIEENVTDTGFIYGKFSPATISYYHCIFSGLDSMDFGDYEKAIQLLNDALTYDSTNLDSWFFQRLCYNRMNDSKKAKLCQEKTDEELCFDHAKLFYRTKNYTRALIYLKKMVELHHDNPGLWESIGACAGELGDYKHAQLCYNYAEKLHRKIE